MSREKKIAPKRVVKKKKTLLTYEKDRLLSVLNEWILEEIWFLTENLEKSQRNMIADLNRKKMAAQEKSTVIWVNLCWKAYD